MIIREGTRERDEDACVALWIAALESRDGAIPPASSTTRAHAKFARPIVRLGMHNDGFALTVRESPEIALLELIAVAPDATSRGVGGALLDDAVTTAAVGGYAWLDLWVRRGNDRAMNLYLSRGFEGTGATEAHHLGGPPMLHFRRALTVPEAAVAPSSGRKPSAFTQAPE